MLLKNLKTTLGAMLLASAASGAYSADLIGYISPIAAQPGQQMINEAIGAAAKEKGWQFRVLDANLSADRQVSHVDTLLSLGAKVIGAWSLDANAVAGAYSRANAQGVPVIGLNSTGQGVTNTVWWETNLCKKGGAYDQQVAWIVKR